MQTGVLSYDAKEREHDDHALEYHSGTLTRD